MYTQSIQPHIRRLVLGGTLIATLGLSACAVYPTGYGYDGYGYGYGNETVVTVPAVRYAPPYPKARWAPGRCNHGRCDHGGRDHWRRHDGRWR